MRPRGISPLVRGGEFLGVDPTTGRGAGRDEYREEIERLVEEVVNEKLVELHHRIMDRVRRELEAFEERVAQSGVDERTVKSIARAVAGQEFARLHGIVREELDKVRTEVEEKLNRLGLDAEAVRRLVDEVYNKLLSDLSGIIDRRIMHVLSVIDEQNSSIKDILDLVNALLESEVKSEEMLEKLRSEIRKYLNEEYLEELAYRALVKHGIIRKRRRRWGWVAVGLGIPIAIVVGLLINPAITFVILAIVFVVLMRW
jgi:predicted transcriptional regulator